MKYRKWIGIAGMAVIALLGAGNAWANDVGQCEKLFEAKLFNQAMPICKQASLQGIMEAQHILGFMYAGGQGVQKDYTEAAKWQRKAAEQGLADAQSSLGTMYNLGKGVKKDHAEALRWWHKAAKHGYTEAQFFLGYSYFLNKNYAKAVRWWRSAADQGNAQSQYMLGLLYSIGAGVKRSGKLSAEWLYKAGLSYVKEKNWKEALISVQRIRELSNKYHFTIPNADLANKLQERIYESKKALPSYDVNGAAKKIADVMADKLPMKMSRNEVIEKVFSIRNTLIFVVLFKYDKQYLIKITKQSGITMGDLNAKESEIVKTHICSSKETRNFVNQGGVIQYRFQFIDGSPYLKIKIDHCSTM